MCLIDSSQNGSRKVTAHVIIFLSCFLSFSKQNRIWFTRPRVAALQAHLGLQPLSLLKYYIYRKRGSYILYVRSARWERVIQREWDGSDLTLVALKLAMSFALFLAKNVHLSIGEEFCTFLCQKFVPLSPILNGAEFTFSVGKNVALFEAVRIVCRKVLLLSNGVTGDWITETNNGTVLLLIEKMNQINTQKPLEIEKEILREVALGG